MKGGRTLPDWTQMQTVKQDTKEVTRARKMYKISKTTEVWGAFSTGRSKV